MSLATLVAHPSTPCEFIHAFTVEVRPLPANALHLIYRLEGHVDHLSLPAPQQPARTDELWRHTCFEAFVRTPEGAGYMEFNFAPSGLWAAYRFAGYRSEMQAMAPATPPSIVCRQGPRHLEVDVQLELARSVRGPLRAALSAVLEDSQGRIFYWALAHPPGRPDFHDPAGFALTLDSIDTAPDMDTDMDTDTGQAVLGDH